MPTEKPVPITRQGLARLQAELQDLITTRRPVVAARIHETRDLAATSQGDGEYEDARNEQAFLEGRIRTLERILANAEIIEEQEAHDKNSVHVGATVTVSVGRREQRFTIVGMVEVDPAHGFVSDESPVGRALLGHKVDDTVEVQAPAGPVKMKIKAIE